MFNQIRHVGGRRALLLAVFLCGASWSGLAAAQPSQLEIAQAEYEYAEAAAAAAKARLNLLRLGGKPAEPSNTAAQKVAEADTTPKTTPELNPSSKAAGEAKDKKPAKPDKNVETDEDTKTEQQKAEAKGRQEFGGLEFGVGISFTADVGSNDRITEAELVNGLVRVKDEDNGRARIMLESHYFFKPCARPKENETCTLPFGIEPGDFGWGPFIALQPGTDNIIEAVAIGGMVGFRRPGTGTESFNLGLGVVIDPNTRILGDGIVANEPLPVGETTIRYKEKMQTGVLLLASFGF